MKVNFKPGLYEHYKGRRYNAIRIVIHHETLQPWVLYVSDKYNPSDPNAEAWIRPLNAPSMSDVSAWTDVVGVPSGLPVAGVKRFRFIEERKPSKNLFVFFCLLYISVIFFFVILASRK